MENATTKKRLDRWILISALTWACSYIASLLVITKLTPPPVIGVLLTGLLGLAFAWFLYLFVRGIGTKDEVARRIQLEATAIAFCLTTMFLMVLGLLDMVIALNPDDWSLRHLLPFPMIFYFLGLAWARRKYS